MTGHLIDGAKGVYTFANYRIRYGDIVTVDTMRQGSPKVYIAKQHNEKYHVKRYKNM